MRNTSVDAEIVTTPNQWVESIPSADVLTLDDVLHAGDIALSEAKALIRKIVDSHRGGTLPPPPWPAHPELVTAMDKMEDLARGAEWFIKRKAHKLLPDPTKRMRAALIERGLALFREIEHLEQRWDLARSRTETMAQAAHLMARYAAPGGLLLAVGIGALLLLEHGSGGSNRRGRRGILDRLFEL